MPEHWEYTVLIDYVEVGTYYGLQKAIQVAEDLRRTRCPLYPIDVVGDYRGEYEWLAYEC